MSDTDTKVKNPARGAAGRAAAVRAAAKRRAARAIAELEAQGYVVTLTRA